ncbi:MAG TPA: FAD-binding monooxygenase, partial [Pseudolabrys sp.]
PDRPAKALRAYEKTRRKRVQRAQKAARKQGRVYGRSGPEGALRNLALKMMGGERLLAHYDWLYRWQPPQAKPIPLPAADLTME